MVGMLLMSKLPSAEELSGALADAGFEVSHFGEGEQRVLSVDDEAGTLFVTPVPTALAGDDVMNNIHPMLTGEDEVPQLGNHQAHLVVVAVNFAGECSRAARRHLHQLHAWALSALMGDDRVVGYAMEGTTMGSAALRAELGDASQPPLHVWVPAWVWSGDEGVTGYTYGLSNFGHPEIQLVDAEIGDAEAYVVLGDLVGYVVSGVDLEEGATVGVMAGKRASVVKRNWVVDSSRAAWQLEM